MNFRYGRSRLTTGRRKVGGNVAAERGGTDHPS